MIIIILAITIVTLLAILVIDAIFTTQRTIIENQKEVNEKLVNSINEVTNKLTSTEIEESEVIENE